MAAQAMNLETVPTVKLSHLTDAQNAHQNKLVDAIAKSVNSYDFDV